MTPQVTAVNSKGVSAAYISSKTDDRAQCEAILRGESLYRSRKFIAHDMERNAEDSCV